MVPWSVWLLFGLPLFTAPTIAQNLEATPTMIRYYAFQTETDLYIPYPCATNRYMHCFGSYCDCLRNNEDVADIRTTCVDGGRPTTGLGNVKSCVSERSICITDTIRASSGDLEPRTQMNCASKTNVISEYTRQLPLGARYKDSGTTRTVSATIADYGTPVSALSTMAITVTPGSSPTTAILYMNATALTLTLAQETAPPATEETIRGRRRSQSWIAGAVVGPVMGITVLIGGLLFFRRKQKPDDTEEKDAPLDYNSLNHLDVDPKGIDPSTAPHTAGPHELEQLLPPPPSELESPSEQKPPSELEGSNRMKAVELT